MGSVTDGRASVRRHVRIAAPADRVWELIGDPARVHEWFPGIVASTVEGNSRQVTTGSGMVIPETIITNDHIQRRFQYRITAPMVREHLSTIDVLDMGDGTTVVVYAADADPSTMALVIGGAGGNALRFLRQLVEGDT